jgi:hypothetical protein
VAREYYLLLICHSALGSVLGSIAGGTYLGIGFWMTTIGYVSTQVVGENILSDEEKNKIKL